MFRIPSKVAVRSALARLGGRALILVASALASFASAAGDPATEVLTNNYDEARTGANLRERVLDTATVRPSTFGRLFTMSVDAPVFGQPLVAAAVPMADGRPRNLLYVTTAANSVYAFDADAAEPVVVWRRSFERLPDGKRARPRGIMSTPVIDRSTGKLYVVSGLMAARRLHFFAHALDIGTGADRSPPALVQGSVTIAGETIPFTPTEHRIAVQRAALALAKDRLIVAFGGDFFEGWVFALDTRDLAAPAAAFCTTCTSRVKAISGVDYLDEKCSFLGPAGGVWQSGRGPVVDGQGQVLFFTGNKAHFIHDGCAVAPSTNACSTCTGPAPCKCEGVGSTKVCRGPDTCTATATPDGGMFDLHDAMVRLDPARGLGVTGWFRPGNWNVAGPEGLEINDLDLGGSGPLLIPGTDRLIGAGKQGVMYLLDAHRSDVSCTATPTSSCLAHPSDAPVQAFRIAPAPPSPDQYYRHVFGGPVLWSRPAEAGGAVAYVWREHDHLRAYRLTDRFADCADGDVSLEVAPDCSGMARSDTFIGHHPGGILGLSANGADPRSAIVWASTARVAGGGGRLMAFGAVPEPAVPDRLPMLWDSDGCPEDAFDSGSGFVPPTIANGRVFVPTLGGTVEVFGKISPRACQGVGPGLAPSTLRM